MKPALLALVFCLSACAPGETVTVRLVTGLERNSPAPNLLETLSRNPELQSTTTTLGFPCIQSDIRAGFKNEATGELSGIPVPVLTNSSIPNATLFTDAIASLSFPEIRLQLPRNVPVSVGIVGSITTGPADVAGGRCMKFEGDETSPNLIYSTFSFFGAREFPNGVSNESVIPVRVWGIAGSGTISTLPCTTATNDCPGRKFVKVELPSGVNSRSIKIRYFEGEGLEYRQYLSLTSLGQGLIPKAEAIRVAAWNSTSSSWEECSSQATGGLIPIQNLGGGALNVICGSNNNYSNPDLIFSSVAVP